jgi:hypothetical protein
MPTSISQAFRQLITWAICSAASFFNRLGFNNHGVFRQKIGEKLTDHVSSEKHLQGHLSCSLQPLLSQSDQQRFFLDRFQKAGAQFVADFEAGPDDFLRQIPMLHRKSQK